ncbi:MAG: prepilin-type N-terminal cleavage/methylation domain-containing protein [Candidatus Eisenbacteria bacterium]|nr:prepilin-type N-terminal cleavage/methylation domain-containing protein [Candidatus Eisenbacteria bacterium]
MSARACSVPRAPRRPAAAGFTLIELSVAIVVFAVGALALAALIPLGSNRQTQGGELTRASSLAARCCETLLTTPYDDPDLDPGTHDDLANPYLRRYYVHWSVEADQPITACKRITVTVTRPASTSPALVRIVIVSPQSGG